MTYRIAHGRRGGREEGRTASVAWRRRPALYFHERRWLAAALFTAAAAKFGIVATPTFLEWRASFPIAVSLSVRLLGDRVLDAPAWIVNAIDALQFAVFEFENPVLLLWLALLWSTFRAAIRRRVSEAEAARVAAIPSLPPVRFTVVWLSCVASIAAGAFSLAWLSFAVWLAPWQLVRWP